MIEKGQTKRVQYTSRTVVHFLFLLSHYLVSPAAHRMEATVLYFSNRLPEGWMLDILANAYKVVRDPQKDETMKLENIILQVHKADFFLMTKGRQCPKCFRSLNIK